MKRTVELSLEKAREWYQKGGELKEVALQAYKEEELKTFTYEDVCKELFQGGYFYIDLRGRIHSIDGICESDYTDENNAISKYQLEKLLAINKLVNVAKYLNDGWEPDWNNTLEYKYFIYYDSSTCKFEVSDRRVVQFSIVYFKSSELAKKAIDILGYDCIKLAIAENW